MGGTPTIRRMAKLVVVATLALGLAAGDALTQGRSSQELTLTFENTCSQPTVVINQIVLTDGRNLDVTVREFELPPGESVELAKELGFVPNRLGVGGTIDGEEFGFNVDPLPLNERFTPDGAEGCLAILVEAPGAQTQPPPEERDKPIQPGDGLQTVRNALQLAGIQLDEVAGSQSEPKIADVASPTLVRSIPGSSFQVLWVGSSAGQLRSAISWDEPNVDLDLLVFSNAGSCFQLNGPGVLAELCDRPSGSAHGPTGGPVSGSIFAVMVVNWSSPGQAYTLTLSP